MKPAWATTWTPYVSVGTLRVFRTSFGGQYEFCSEGGRYFVLARSTSGPRVESPRGTYRQALEIWVALVGDQAHDHSAP